MSGWGYCEGAKLHDPLMGPWIHQNLGSRDEKLGVGENRFVEAKIVQVHRNQAVIFKWIGSLHFSKMGLCMWFDFNPEEFQFLWMFYELLSIRKIYQILEVILLRQRS